MPEGDTVFRTAHRLHGALAGKPLAFGEIRHPRLSTIDMREWIIDEVAPVGKHIFIRFSNQKSLHHHLRMDGIWHVHETGARWRRPAHHARVILRCADYEAVGFRLHDLKLVRNREEHRLIDHLGPDLLAEHWPEQRYAEVARKVAAADTAIGLALLNQRVAAGIGNVYMNEVCFLLGVSPHTPTSELDEQLCDRAIRTARRLLWDNRWRTHRTTTGDQRPGRDLWVYQRASKPCRHCGTAIHSTQLVNGPDTRTVWMCPQCQSAIGHP